MADMMIINILANLTIERAEEREPRQYLFTYSHRFSKHAHGSMHCFARPTPRLTTVVVLPTTPF